MTQGFRSVLFFSLLLAPLATGCGARQVVRTGDYGVVAIPSNSNLIWPFDYRNQAERLMAGHFPEGYVIEREEETVVGETVDTEQERTSNQILGGLVSVGQDNTKTRQTTTDETEWRIYYRRAGGSGAALSRSSNLPLRNGSKGPIQQVSNQGKGLPQRPPEFSRGRGGTVR